MAYIQVKDIKNLGGFVIDTDEIPGLPVTLQSAYEGGDTININATSVNIINEQPGIYNLLLAQNPGADENIIRMVKSFDSLGLPAIHIEVSEITDSGIVLRNEAEISHESGFTGKRLYFASTNFGDNRDLVQIETTAAQPGIKASTLYLRGGAGDSGDLCGDISLGFAADATSEDGGLLLEATTGRVSVRKHSLSIPPTPGSDSTGTLNVPTLTELEESLLTPLDGDIHRRQDVDAGPFRNNGFRGYQNNAHGLFCRGVQRTFEDADLVAGVLTLTHNLATNGVGIFIYDNTGALVPIATAPLFPSVLEVDENSVDVTITAGAIAGTWRIMAIGF